jgi:hypothetical protein
MTGRIQGPPNLLVSTMAQATGGPQKLRQGVPPVHEVEETVCLEDVDAVREVLLAGPNLCIICGGDLCESSQMKMETLAQDRMHSEDVGMDAAERNSRKRKRAYKCATRCRSGVLGLSVCRTLPSFIKEAIHSLCPPVDGRVV